MTQVRTIVRSREDGGRRGGYRTASIGQDHFQVEKEFVRALTAAKLKQMFAKPFIRAMNDHVDGVYNIARHPSSITTFATASVDGCVKIYDISSGAQLSSLMAHTGWITGVCFPSCTADMMVTCARDSLLRFWKLPDIYTLNDQSVPLHRREIHLISSINLEASPAGLAHHAADRKLALATPTGVHVFDHERQEALACLTYSDGGIMDSSFSTVQFNQAEQHLVAATSETYCVFFDIRVHRPAFRFSLWSRPSCITFNNYYPNVLAVGANDGYCYSFDIRNFSRNDNYRALDRFTGNTGAVLSCAFSPDGSVLATGGYDKAVRLYDVRTVGPNMTLKNHRGEVIFQSLETAGLPMGETRDKLETIEHTIQETMYSGVSKSRNHPFAFNIQPYDTYHSSRMMRVWALAFSGDGRFLLTGSDDANLRVWKTRASESLKTLAKSEADAIDYRETLVNKFQNVPAVRQVLKSHRLPHLLNVARRRATIHNQAERRKDENRRTHRHEEVPSAASRVVHNVDK